MKLYTSLLASRYPGFILHNNDTLTTGKEVIYNGILYKCLVPHTYNGDFKEEYFDQISILEDHFRDATKIINVSSKTFDNSTKTLTVVPSYPSSKLYATLDIIVYDSSTWEIVAFSCNNAKQDSYVLTSDLFANYTSASQLKVGFRMKQSHEYSPRLNTPVVSSIEFYLRSTKMLIHLSNHDFRNRLYKVDIRSNDLHEVFENLEFDTDLNGILVPTTTDIVQSGNNLTVKVQTYQ